MPAMERDGKKPAGARPDDHRPGRLPNIVSTHGNLIWRCRVYAQPPNTRLVLRASADGHLWASIGKGDATTTRPQKRPSEPS